MINKTFVIQWEYTCMDAMNTRTIVVSAQSATDAVKITLEVTKISEKAIISVRRVDDYIVIE